MVRPAAQVQRWRPAGDPVPTPGATTTTTASTTTTTTEERLFRLADRVLDETTDTIRSAFEQETRREAIRNNSTADQWTQEAQDSLGGGSTDGSELTNVDGLGPDPGESAKAEWTTTEKFAVGAAVVTVVAVGAYEYSTRRRRR